jgi:hypothetical protein
MMILVRIVVTLTSTPETILSKLSCQNLIQFSGKKLRLRRTATHKKKIKSNCESITVTILNVKKKHE